MKQDNQIVLNFGSGFFRVPNRIFDLYIARTPLLVFIFLCSMANRDGECWPSRRRIARQCRCCVSTVDAALKVLVQQHLISKETRTRPNGSFSSNAFRVRFI